MKRLALAIGIFGLALYSYLVGHRHGVERGIAVGRVRELLNEGYTLTQAHHRLKTDPVSRYDYPEKYNPRSHRH